MPKVGVEASEASGVQGLDPNENSQPLMLMGVWDPRDLACLS